jgi:ankyrin repeat protein
MDLYGNTILHCAAANVQPDCYWKINVMVTDENFIHRVNTMGQSFLHLLCESPLLSSVDIEAFIRLLRELQARNFSLSTRDYHGQTFLHILLNITDICMLLIPALSEIFSIVQPELNEPDSSGFKISERLLSDPRIKSHYPAIQDIVRQYSNGSSIILSRSFSGDCTSTSSIISWIERRIQSNDVTSLSDDGDTMLSYILNHGPSTDGGRFLANCARKLTAAGARIHMRDRSGDTPLCIAARRGLRPVVTLLLRRRAHVHSRNYKGVGILAQAEAAMIEAKSMGNEVRYSGILSCIVTLIEAGAKCEPREEDEWISRTVVTQAQERGMDSPANESPPGI